MSKNDYSPSGEKVNRSVNILAIQIMVNFTNSSSCSQKAVSAYFTSKQIHFGFAEQAYR